MATAAQTGTIIHGIPDGSFTNLTDGLQRKFMDAGLRPEHGTRSAAEAQALYQESVPSFVRNYGENIVSQFLQSKDASHIRSVENAPHLATETGNTLWESSSINRARSSTDMTGWEQFTTQADNAFDAWTIVMRECATAAATSGLLAGLLEAPVASIENYIHYQKGHKTGEQAVKNAAKSIAVHTGPTAVVGIDVIIEIGMGAGPLIATLATILTPVGLALYGFNAFKRILEASEASTYDLPRPLNLVGTYLCSPCCHTRFAYETGKSVLIRWEANRIAPP